MMPPLVDLADSGHPAQSESVYLVIILGVASQRKCITNRGYPTKYLAMRFKIFQCDSFRLDMCLEHSFTAN